ncbi:MAG: zinc-ribbon domain-containing protein [Lachnospiraceae bacterium]|nr:zinc-ribbon domain-containing protein [Lachnospiraceae bacterium]
MNCPKCGQQVSFDEQFCSQCGADITSALRENKNEDIMIRLDEKKDDQKESEVKEKKEGKSLLRSE